MQISRQLVLLLKDPWISMTTRRLLIKKTFPPFLPLGWYFCFCVNFLQWFQMSYWNWTGSVDVERVWWLDVGQDVSQTAGFGLAEHGDSRLPKCLEFVEGQFVWEHVGSFNCWDSKHLLQFTVAVWDAIQFTTWGANKCQQFILGLRSGLIASFWLHAAAEL